MFRQFYRKQVKNISEKGRSMVEMLGVLAIVGVLTMGGIAGYVFAMEKHRSNTLLSEMNDVNNQIALLLLRGNVYGISLQNPYDAGKLILSDFATLKYGCGHDETATNPACYGVKDYYMTFGNIPYGVCRETAPVAKYLHFAQQLSVNNVENGLCSFDGNNTIKILFKIEPSRHY